MFFTLGIIIGIAVGWFANEKWDNERLITYTEAYGNIALTKRLGFLATPFHADSLQGFIQYARKQVNKKRSKMRMPRCKRKSENLKRRLRKRDSSRRDLHGTNFFKLYNCLPEL